VALPGDRGGRAEAIIAADADGVVLRDPAGAVAGAAAIVRDVTERWQQERALRQRLQELEARRAEQ
jgi:signal transduction histidine kinase